MIIILKLLKHQTDSHSSNAPNLYSVDAWFEFRPGHQLSQQYFRGIPQSLRARLMELSLSTALVSQLQLWHRQSLVPVQSVGDRSSQVFTCYT
jgi:hypothetical protein